VLSEQFWKVIEAVDRTALDEGNEEGAVEGLTSMLAARGEATMRAFTDKLAEALYALDGRAYADNAGESGESDDGFLYARCYVVARGREFYEAVLANPAKMPTSVNRWCESLLYVAQNAWAEATGSEPGEWDYSAPLSYETGSNAAAWGER